jgi:peptidoglycan/LPS O-acetylase OafA/YrhL
MWIFFLWGLGLAWGGVWLIRGRSKGKAIVFARDRKRLVAVALLAILVVGLLIFLMSQPSLTDDAVWWPLMLQTMFANLFASLPFALFDREDYKERREPAQLDTAGRRKVRQRTILVVVVGGLMLTAGLTVGQQMDPWWEDVLVRLGVGLLACAAVLGYKLRKSSRPASGTDST